MTEVGPEDDVRAAIAALSAGDELVLRAGLYVLDSKLAITVAGTASSPVTIRSNDSGTAVLAMNTPDHNVVEISDTQYLVFRGLKITGGSHGIRLMNSDFVTIEDNEIYETGDVALSANAGGTYEGLVIRRNHIHHTNGTGEGMYLGCNYDACRVLNSVIEWNYVHHTNRATVEQGDGIEVKEGSAGNVIRHNVVHDTHYPGIITYGVVGNGPPNVIEGNAIWNSGDYAIQSAADSIIRNNIVLGTVGLQPHQASSPGNQTIVHNTIVSAGNGIEVRGVSGPVVIANNAVYSGSGNALQLISGDIGLVVAAGNVGTGGLAGGSMGYIEGNGIAADLAGANFDGAPPIDVFPSQASVLLGVGAAAYVPETDFNGTPRRGTADAGAYKGRSEGNPGWTIAAAFKGASGDPSTLIRSGK
jgi:hypothetical protein